VRQRTGLSAPKPHSTGDLGGHEKEGTGWGFRNAGRERKPKREPLEVRTQDFGANVTEIDDETVGSRGFWYGV